MVLERNRSAAESAKTLEKIIHNIKLECIWEKDYSPNALFHQPATLYTCVCAA